MQGTILGQGSGDWSVVTIFFSLEAQRHLRTHPTDICVFRLADGVRWKMRRQRHRFIPAISLTLLVPLILASSGRYSSKQKVGRHKQHFFTGTLLHEKALHRQELDGEMSLQYRHKKPTYPKPRTLVVCMAFPWKENISPLICQVTLLLIWKKKSWCVVSTC